jgi:DNA-binding transcriptional MerR regulator
MINLKRTGLAYPDLLRISDLARETGVSLPTIHYYVREGLIFPAIKTARNMAYYGPDCVDDIRLIKELQTRKYLPLSVIKLIMQAKREGQDVGHVAEMESILTDVFQPVANEAKYKGISFSELVSASGLAESDVKTLETEGLIVPEETERGLTYDDIDVRIAQGFKRLADLGVKPRNLDIYRQYMEIIRHEFKTVHDTLHQLPNHEVIPLHELFKIITDFKKYLALRIYREEARLHVHSHPQGENR